MKKKDAFMYFFRGVFLITAMAAMAGCAGSRTVMIAPLKAESRTAVSLPLSVRVELTGVKQENPNPVTPILVDRESLHAMLVAYLNTRNVFQAVDGRSADSVLNIDAKYRLITGNSFEYTVDLKALITSREGLDLGRFSGQSRVMGGASRFMADADSAPMNEAFKEAVEDLCRKIEDNRPLILAKLGRYDELKQMTKESAAAARAAPAVLPLPAAAIPSDIAELPPRKARPNKHAYAVVIGIERYRQKLPQADFAAGDANLMGEYLARVMGYPEENVVVLTNENATKGDFEKYFERWLVNNVEKNSAVFVYYSGHGAPDPKTGGAYLVPYDGDPTFIAETGYSLKRLYGALGNLPAKEIIVVLDSCFSGAGGRSVLADGARPLVMNLQANLIPSRNMTVLAASSGEQISSTYKEKKHGLFTYFLLKGIKDEDVIKPDGSLKMDDLMGYLKPQVERIARKKYNNTQTPQLIGAKKN